MGQTLSNPKLGVSGHLLKCDVSHKAPGPKNEQFYFLLRKIISGIPTHSQGLGLSRDET